MKASARFLGYFSCFVLLFCGLLPAQPIARELGENLTYVRMRTLPADLPSAELKTGPLVLDLRYTVAEPEAATALHAWLAFRATPRTPVFILVNSGTAPVLLRLFANPLAHPDVLTIGRKADNITPDVPIAITEEDERRAYDALSPTTSIDALINENLGKTRTDEASMMRERAESREPHRLDDLADHTAPAAKNGDSPAPVPVDRPLQRAVHLHRAMLALKRL